MDNQTTQVSNCNSPGCTGDCKTEIYMPCEVCSLVHGDTSVKKVFYCEVCHAYICCKKCRYDLVSRALAATIKAGNKIKNAFKTSKEDEKTETTNGRTKKYSKSDDVPDRVQIDNDNHH